MQVEVSAETLRQAAWVRRVSDGGIQRICGDLAYERGQGYVDAERVQSISTGDQGRLLLATVGGSRTRPYSTMVTALGSDDVYGEPAWTGRCSCPVQTTCKHVAAVLLAAREHLNEADGVPAPRPWRRQLDDALGTAARPRRRSRAGAQEPQSGALALGLVQDRRGNLIDIEMRPTRPTKSGTWHRGLGWGQVVGPQNTSGIHRRQVSALRALHRSTARSYWHQPGQPLLLSEVAPEFWVLLRRVLDEGVELVPDPAHPAPVSTTVRPETVWCGVLLDENDDGSVQVRASVPDLPEDATPIALGTPPSAVAWIVGTHLTIAPCEDEIDFLTANLLGRRPISVPAEEVPEFVETYLPRLEETTAVRRPGEGAERATEADRVRLHLRVSALEGGGVQIDQRIAYGADLMPVDLTHAFVGRRRLEEQALVERVAPELSPLGLMERVGGLSWWPLAQVSLDGLAAARFMEILDGLARQDDLVIERVGELPVFEEITAEPLIEVGTEESDEPRDTDWFDLHVSVSIDGEEVPFEPLFQALARGDGHMMLASGSYFSLDHPGLHRLRDLIAEAREMQDRPGEGTKVNRYQVGLWEELVALGVVGEQAGAWAESVERLRSLDTVSPPEPPATLQATLRPYQQDGYSWLATLWDARLGGILADDMGLGKTVQVLAALERARAAGDLTEPVLVVAPTSMVGVWVSEAERFAPELRVAQAAETSGKRGTGLEQIAAEADVVVTTYTVLRIDAEAFHEIDWRGLVLDEAQAVKNHQSKIYQAVRRIRAPFRLAMSGTPLENSLMDLWALLSVTAPGLYPKPEEFTTRYRRPIESGKAPELLAQLRRRIRPLMMRRTKDEVAADLPEKQIQIANIALTPVHARIYEQHLQRERQRVLGLLDDPDANQIAILAALTRLRQLALDPVLIDDTYADVTPSAKLTALVEHIQELASEGHRALVFSQFTRYLKRAGEALARAGIDSCYLDGTMSAKARAAEVEAFRGGGAPAFLISLKAGGTGLTLTEADYVFVLDPWWNPATEAQAIDRTHRIGQDKPVMVYRMVSQGTIEDKVVALQQRKRDLFDQVLGDGGALSGAITSDDVKGLLDL